MQSLPAFRPDRATLRRRQAARVRRELRFEAASSLASGLAHDLGKVVTPMLLAAELARRPDRPQPPPALFDILVSGASSTAALVRRLHAVAGGIPCTPAPFDLRPLLDEIAAVASKQERAHPPIQVRAPKRLPRLTGDRARLRQALLNLCENACEATPKGGTLSLQARLVSKREAGLSGRSGSAGLFVRISIVDTGPGLATELADRVFDPCFTTKHTGRATGLGLPIAYSIVRSHGGQMDFESTRGKGTRVHVYLPVDASAGGLASAG